MTQKLSIAKQEWVNPDGIRLLVPQGIIGFHDLKHYVLLPIISGEAFSPFWLLKSHEYSEIAFILLESEAIRERIALDLGDVAAVAIKHSVDVQKCNLFFITTIEKSPNIGRRTTVNLRAPVLIDFQQKHVWQLILMEEKYPIDYQL